MNKKETKAMQNQMILDRLEVKGIGAAWCHLHQCRPHTCFKLYYPTSSKRGIKTAY